MGDVLITITCRCGASSRLASPDESMEILVDDDDVITGVELIWSPEPSVPCDQCGLSEQAGAPKKPDPSGHER